MSEQEGEKKTFVVNDRRRFDPAGNEKADQPKQPEQKPIETAQKITATKPADEFIRDKPPQASSQTGAAGSEPAINFTSFVMSLGMQGLMQLGVIPAPDGTPLEVDRHGAQQTIDILAMVQEKTKGNLDQEEVTLLEEVLHNLRISFVRGR